MYRCKISREDAQRAKELLAASLNTTLYALIDLTQVVRVSLDRESLAKYVEGNVELYYLMRLCKDGVFVFRNEDCSVDVCNAVVTDI